MKGTSVLVTGGAGFIGSHLVRHLIAEGARVRVLDNLSTGSCSRLSELKSLIDFHEGDMRDPTACRKACKGADIVFHLAAYVSVPGSMRDPVHADSINIGGTLNMLLASRDSRVRRFIFSSSAAVYGESQSLPLKEDGPAVPISPYGVQKLYGEQTAYVFHRQFGIETISLRYFNVYGPGQNPNSDYAAVIPRFTSRLIEGIPPIIYGDGRQTRDFLYVEDVARANLAAANAAGISGRVYNVASGRVSSLNQLFNGMRAVIGSDLEPEYGPEREGDIKHSSADVSRAHADLGFSAAVGIEEGVSRTVDYFRTIIESR